MQADKKKYKKFYTAVNEFVSISSVIRKLMLTNFEDRKTILRSPYIRKYAAKEVYEAESIYWKAISVGERKKYDSLKIISSILSKQYVNIFSKTLTGKTIEVAKDNLSSYIKSVQQDLAILENADLSTSLESVEAVNGVIQRAISPFQPDFGTDITDLFEVGEPPYYPPVDNTGPRAPVAVSLTNIRSNAVDISFYDVSHKEDGNRILRSDDLLTWNSIEEVGKVKFSKEFTYTDDDLQRDKQYCYRVETYNEDGSNESQLRCVYTKDTTHVDIWRVQLRIKIADISNADLDAPIVVRFSDNGETLPVSYYLDYSIDDFERNSNYNYDIGFDGLKKLSDIVGFSITNTSTEHCYIESIDLTVDERSIFSRTFGTTTASALDLVRFPPYEVSYEELRSSPGWIALIDNKNTPLPQIEFVTDTTVRVVINKNDIRSMLESLVGNLLHTDLVDLLSGGINYQKAVWS